MEGKYRAFTNIYKLFKRSSLKYGSFSFEIEGGKLRYKFIFIDNEIILEKYEDDELKERKVSSTEGIDIIGKYYSTTQMKPLMKKLFLEAVAKKSKDNSIYMEFDIAEISDLALAKNKIVLFDFYVDNKKVPFLINHIDTESLYMVDGKEVGFYKFVEYINRNNLDFKLLKSSIIKDISSQSTGFGVGVVDRNYESLGLERKVVNGRMEVDFEGLLKKVKKDSNDDKSSSQAENLPLNEGGVTKSKLLDQILFGKNSNNNNNLSGKVINNKK